MVSITTPSNYKARITPYSQRLLQYGINDSKLYLAKTSNSLLEAFTLGYDEETYDTTSGYLSREYLDRKECILDGLQSTYELNGTTLEVTVGRGNIICDNTMLSFPKSTTLDFDLDDYDDTGFLVVSISYKWIEQVTANPPYMRFCYVSEDTMTVEEDDWTVDTDRLVITVFDFEKDISGAVTSVTCRSDDPFTNLERDFVYIKETPYEIAPLPNFWYQMLRGVHDKHARRLIYTISGDGSNWIADTAPFEGTGNYCYCPIDIGEIGQKDCMVQCYINDLKIEPAAIQLVSTEELRIWMPDYFTTQSSVPELKVIIMG